jgi:transcriptional regulator with XRE-family HTH domain
MTEGENVGDRIKARRLELDWVQDELAIKAGISKGFLSDLENGKRDVGAAKLLSIAQAIGVSLDYLMKGTGAKQASKEENVKIPSRLADLAERHKLSFADTVRLLKMQAQIVAHRSLNKSDDLDSFDWDRFYRAVQQYLHK